ncbi:hypothetical protein ABIB96_001286 [Bradyrhizobium sp. LA3.X]|uniref:M15 family metallopeptidase n=2 Tax=Bradyrhizobium TaxID=374 RepID=UPI00339579AA
MVTWPKDNQTARNAFYGDPGKGQIAPQMVPVVPPFAMYYEGQRVRAIQFHKKAAPALLAALNEIWDYCQHDQAKIDAAGVSKYAGAYNHRMVRGSSTKWSNHAYAAAIDLNAEENGLYAKGNMPQFVIDAFCRQGWMWGGWYSGRKDPMHFEAVDNGGRKPKSPPPVFGVAQRLVADPVTGAPADELEDDSPAPAALTVDTIATGDPELFSVQKRLKAINYSPGVIDGLWGSGTSGAVAGFINDRGGEIPVPASFDAFNRVREAIKAELGRAEGEGWKRPVSDARKAADTKTVEAVAPEVVPVKRNFWAAAWAAVVSFLTAIWDWLSNAVGSAWEFFTDHKDDIPTDSGFLHTAWGYLSGVPGAVWALAIGGLFVFIAINSRSGVNKITAQVQSGARQ